MSTPTRKRRLVTQAQAARHVQVTPRTVRNWIGRGFLTGYRVGPRRVVVDLDELEAMLKRIPSTRVRDGRKVYGRDARIIDMQSEAAK